MTRFSESAASPKNPLPYLCLLNNPIDSMDIKPSVSIVIPCHNEAQAIPDVLPQIQNKVLPLAEKGVFSSVEVIVVNDGSTDATVQKLNEYSWIRTVHLPRQSGYGAAIKAGFDVSQGEVVAFFDMDSTYDPSDLVKLVSALQEKKVSLVLGERLTLNSGMPAIRKLGNLFFSRMIQVLFRHPMRDSCTGFRVFKRELLAPIRGLPHDDFNFSFFMSIWAIQKRIPFCEIPIHYYERRGPSKLNAVREGLKFLWLTFALYTSRERTN